MDTSSILPASIGTVRSTFSRGAAIRQVAQGFGNGSSEEGEWPCGVVEVLSG